MGIQMIQRRQDASGVGANSLYAVATGNVEGDVSTSTELVAAPATLRLAITDVVLISVAANELDLRDEDDNIIMGPFHLAAGVPLVLQNLPLKAFLLVAEKALHVKASAGDHACACVSTIQMPLLLD